jgi:hypothetical protein
MIGLSCLFGLHDQERLESPPGVMRGIGAPWRCRRPGCSARFDGFRYPPPPTRPRAITAEHQKERASSVCREAFIKAGYWPNEVCWKIWQQSWTASRRAALEEACDHAEAVYAILCSDLGGDIPNRITQAQEHVTAWRAALKAAA